MHLIDIGCDYILNYGLSGGISGICRDELSLCDRFLEHDFDLTGIGYKLCEKPGQKYIYNADQKLLDLAKTVVPNAKLGTAVTGDRFVCDSVLRDLLKNEFNAMSCDMETAAIAYVCDFAEVPFLSIRRISDDAGADAGDSYREMNNADQTQIFCYVLELVKAILNS
jgi:adenosylhomocysteine nucleosidase